MGNKKYCIINVFAEGSIDLTLDSGLTYNEVLKELSEPYIEYIEFNLKKDPKTLGDSELRDCIEEFNDNLDDEYSLGPIVYEVLSSGRLREIEISDKDIIECIKNLS